MTCACGQRFDSHRLEDTAVQMPIRTKGRRGHLLRKHQKCDLPRPKKKAPGLMEAEAVSVHTRRSVELSPGNVASGNR
jgi:hypothetical protein